MQLSRGIFIENYAEDVELIKQGDKKPTECYILLVGSCLVSVDGKFKSKILENALFGELALISDGSRTATVTTTTDTDVLVISKELFVSCVMPSLMLHMKRAAFLLQRATNLKLRHDAITLLASKCLLSQFPAGY